MLHTNVAELPLLCDTFTRVWSSGGQANLSLQTKDSQVWAKLDLQLGPADSCRPGPPEAVGRVEEQPRNYKERPVHPRIPPAQQQQARYKAPGVRARDARRRQEWLDRRQSAVLEKPAAQPEQEHVDLEQTRSITRPQKEPAADETETKDDDKIPDTIPQLDGPPEETLTAPVKVQFKCEQCRYEATTKNMMKYHVRLKH